MVPGREVINSILFSFKADRRITANRGMVQLKSIAAHIFLYGRRIESSISS